MKSNIDDLQLLMTIRFARSKWRAAPPFRASERLLQVRDGSMIQKTGSQVFEKDRAQIELKE
jgi:hypothetical protein